MRQQLTHFVRFGVIQHHNHNLVSFDCGTNIKQKVFVVKVKVVKLVFQAPKLDFDHFDLDHFDTMMPNSKKSPFV